MNTTLKNTQVRDQASKSFEMETRREAEAKRDFAKHQSCEKSNARHCENSFESMIVLQKALHTMSRIRIDRVSTSENGNAVDDDDMNAQVKDMRISGESLMPSLEAERDEIAAFTCVIRGEIELAKHELSCMETRRSSRAKECRDIEAAKDAVLSLAQCMLNVALVESQREKNKNLEYISTGTKRKRSIIVKILSDSNSRLEESEKSQIDRERVMKQRIEWMESSIIVATALQEKCKLRFDYVQRLREKVNGDTFSWKLIRDQVSILTPLSRNMDSNFKTMLNERSEVEDWISRCREEITSDMSDSRDVLLRLEKMRFEPFGCDLNDNDLKLLNENNEILLRAELLIERHKIILNRLEGMGKKMGHLNTMVNAIRVSNAKEMSSLRVVSSKLMVMETSSSNN